MKKLELRDFQKEDVLFMKQNNYRVLVANGQGTGKTIECLACISIDRNMLCPVIIVCPSSVVWNWYNETRKWCKWAKVCTITDKKTKIPQGMDIYIVSWYLMTVRYKSLLRRKPKLLIADECHYAKNDESSRTKALFELAKVSPHILMLSGTPIVNNHTELQTIESVFGEKPPMIRRLLSDVAPDVPEKTRHTLYVHMRQKHVREYVKAFREFEEWLREELAKKLKDGELEETVKKSLVAQALVKIGYLRRIVGKAKVYSAIDFISRAIRVGEPIVVFCEHNETVRRLETLLKKQNIRYVTIKGGTPKNKRLDSVEQFQSGKVPVFIGTKACNTGITLTRSRNLVFLERFWTSADEDQAEDRIRRISQKHKTKIWSLHVKGTVDDRIAQIIEYKRNLMMKTIGLENITEQDQDTVLELMNNWSQMIDIPVLTENIRLGSVKPLPPLPKRENIQSVTFYGKHWNEHSTKSWCRMNKYKPIHIKEIKGGYVYTIEQNQNFKQNTLKIEKISKFIHIVVGEPIEHLIKKPKKQKENTPPLTRKPPQRKVQTNTKKKTKPKKRKRFKI